MRIRWIAAVVLMLLTVAGRMLGADVPPNVILIMADDLGVGELGCYGQKIIRTPNIDRIAAEGIKFTQFYSGSAVCAPSRCSLLTGKHMGHAAVRDNQNPPGSRTAPKENIFPGQTPLPENEITIAEVLKKQQYATAAFGKWGLGSIGTEGDPNRQGFDLFYGYNCQVHAHNHYPRFLWRNDQREILPGNDRGPIGQTYSQDRFTDEALSFIKEHHQGPFFLYFSVTIPHLGLQVPEAALKEYSDQLKDQPYNGAKGYNAHPQPHAAYAAMVTYLDTAVGRIMELVKAQGIDEQTVILFTSDNGPTHDVGGADSPFFDSAEGRRGFKGSLYEGGIRVPLLVRWPGKIKAASTTDFVAAHWDLLPTIAELAGESAPKDSDGVGLLPLLLGKPEKLSPREYLYWEFSGYGGWQAVRMGEWKAVRSKILGNKNKQPRKMELYNINEDPAESRDVAAKHPELVAKMGKQLAESREPNTLFPMRPLDQPDK